MRKVGWVADFSTVLLVPCAHWQEEPAFKFCLTVYTGRVTVLFDTLNILRLWSITMT